jgi:hypothetical protein
MNELKFNSQVCTTIEQSQRLLELGLKPETADMYYHEGSEDGAGNIEYHRNIRTERDNILFPDYIPAWSLHRLIELLNPKTIEFAMPTVYGVYEDVIYNISECIKNGYISKEYLKQ